MLTFITNVYSFSVLQDSTVNDIERYNLITKNTKYQRPYQIEQEALFFFSGVGVATSNNRQINSDWCKLSYTVC